MLCYVHIHLRHTCTATLATLLILLQRGRARIAGTQQLARQWHHVKKSVPSPWTTISKGKVKEIDLWKYICADSGVASMRATFSRAWVSSAKTNAMESRKRDFEIQTISEQVCKYMGKHNEF